MLRLWISIVAPLVLALSLLAGCKDKAPAASPTASEEPATEKAKVDIQAGGNAIQVDGDKGKVDIKGAFGSIKVDGEKGTVKIETGAAAADDEAAEAPAE